MGRYNTDYDGCGIYALFNVINAKIYIGQSKNIKTRFQHHKLLFASKSKVNPMYQEPIENFVFLVLYKCDTETFDKFKLILEELYIHKSQDYGLSIYNKIKHKAGAGFVYSLEAIFDVQKNMDATFKTAFGVRPFRMRLSTLERRKQDLKAFAS